MTPRFRLLGFAALALVAGSATALGAAGCNSILGIGDHTLADGAVGSGDDDDDRDATRADGSVGDDDDDAPSGDDGGSGDETGVGTPCAAGTTRCSGSTMVQGCAVNGTWDEVRACASNACDAGSCVGSTSSAPSCGSAMDAGFTTCGAKQNESCCLSLEVPGGSYFRTFDPTGYDDGGVVLAADGGPLSESDPAIVSNFRLDKFEVTVARFRTFVDALAGDGAAPGAGAGKHVHLNAGRGLGGGGDAGAFETGWDVAVYGASVYTGAKAEVQWTADLTSCKTAYATWTAEPGSQEDLPVTCVDWAQAYAFCIWDGGFLPSEAEWEYAAAGGAQQRPYPWGTTFPDIGEYDHAIAGCNYPTPGAKCTGSSNIAPPGSAIDGGAAWGHMDMAGNVWEWTYDYYSAAGPPDSCVNCTDLIGAPLPDGGFTRVDKGGAYEDPPTYIRTTARGVPVNGAYSGVDNIGFRCARTP